jgi:uncharacterized membrane protein
MRTNLGSLDRAIRVIAALILGWLVYNGSVSGTLAIIASVVALALLLTAAFGYCYLYTLLGIQTCKR